MLKVNDTVTNDKGRKYTVRSVVVPGPAVKAAHPALVSHLVVEGARGATWLLNESMSGEIVWIQRA
jgi:hypothetical protein